MIAEFISVKTGDFLTLSKVLSFVKGNVKYLANETTIIKQINPKNILYQDNKTAVKNIKNRYKYELESIPRVFAVGTSTVA